MQRKYIPGVYDINCQTSATRLMIDIKHKPDRVLVDILISIINEIQIWLMLDIKHKTGIQVWLTSDININQIQFWLMFDEKMFFIQTKQQCAVKKV